MAGWPRRCHRRCSAWCSPAPASRPSRKPGEPENVVERIVDFIKRKPVTAHRRGAIAAGILAVRNPTYLGAVIRAFVEGRDRRGAGGPAGAADIASIWRLPPAGVVTFWPPWMFIPMRER